MEQAELLQRIEGRAFSEKNDSKKFIFLQELGNAYSDEGDYSKALDYYEQALEVARRANQKNLECDALINIGSCLFKLKKFDEAIDTYMYALTLAREIKDFRNLRVIYGKLADAYLWIGKNNQAIESFDQAIASRKEEIGQSNIVHDRITQELSYLKTLQKIVLHDYLSIPFNRRARKILIPTLTSILFLLATVLSGLGINMLTATPPNTVGWVVIALSMATYIIASIISTLLIKERKE